MAASETAQIIKNRQMTDQDKSLIDAINSVSGQSKKFTVDYFELGFSEVDSPAVRVCMEIQRPNRLVVKSPSFSSSVSLQENLAFLEEQLVDTGSLKQKIRQQTDDPSIIALA